MRVVANLPLIVFLPLCKRHSPCLCPLRFACRGPNEVGLVRVVADYVLKHHYPHLAEGERSVLGLGGVLSCSSRAGRSALKHPLPAPDGG